MIALAFIGCVVGFIALLWLAHKIADLIDKRKK